MLNASGTKSSESLSGSGGQGGSSESLSASGGSGCTLTGRYVMDLLTSSHARTTSAPGPVENQGMEGWFELGQGSARVAANH